MTDQMKPLSCDPAKLKGLSGKQIVSHYENNYGPKAAAYFDASLNNINWANVA